MQNKSLVRSLLTLATLLVVGCDSNGSSAPYAGSAPIDNYDPAVNAAAAGAAAAQAGSSAQPASPADAASVVLANGAAFQAYLTDASGRALYVFANDVPGSGTSACTATCVDKWPVFDVKDLSVGTGLIASDFSRFQRADGTWQTAFKGHPLYRFATDATGSVSGDAVGGRWYVARDYLAFVAAKSDVTPQGASMPAPYMTNRMGRTVYVFMNDTAGTPSIPPTSACVGACLDAWPTWNAPATLGSTVVPSSMHATDFGQFERTVAGATVKQFTYRGFPLYFHTPDIAPGATSGHMSGAWRAIDPTTFPAATAVITK
jgi:predicted lipoprotein with Yx(FWY)xxD motif